MATDEHKTDQAEIKRRWGIFRSFMLAFIRSYQTLLSPIMGNQCRFYPTCSEYARLSFQYRNIFKAFFSSIWRILRCNPYNKGGIDYPPDIPQSTIDNELQKETGQSD